jgi:hypothetical protein
MNPGSYSFVHESAVNLFTVFLNPFVYVVLFWIFKLISFGIYLFLDRFIFNRKLKKLFPSPSKKSSISGAILGGFYAILIGAIFFMPVSAYSELLHTTEQATLTAEGQKGAISGLLGEGNYNLAVSYRNTPSYYFYKYTGSKLLGDAMFSSLSKKNVLVTTVSVEKYVPSIAKVYQASKVLLRGVNQGATSSEIDVYLTSFQVVVEEFSSNDLLTGTDEEKLTMVHQVLKQDQVLPENDILKSLMSNMEYSSMEAFEQDMKTLAEFSSLLNEKNLLTGVMSNSSELSAEVILNILDDEFIIQLADKLYTMDQAELFVPMITEKLLGLLLGDTNAGVMTLGKIENFADTKQEFIDVCNSGKKLAYLIHNDMSIDENEARTLLEDSLAILRNSKLISEDTLQRLELILQDKIELYNEHENR